MSETSLAGTIQYGTGILKYTTGLEIESQLLSGALPNTSNSQQIIGHTTTRDSIILFTTDDLGMDCIWKLDNVLRAAYDLKLLYVRNMGFSSERPIQAVFNYENENIQKVYWVDGNQQIRYINLNHSSIGGNESLIDLPSNSINFVGNVNFSQPIITDILSGGTHTSGMIQYGYNLYRLNGSQTKLSPLSALVSLGKGSNLGGGELNEEVGATPVIKIEDIDLAYTHIKIYAIKYTSYNQIPSINLIDERELSGQTSVTLYDDGSTISSLSIEELLFLGSDPIIPKHIESKDNRLFASNIKTKEFVIPIELDCRVYSFPISSTTTSVFNDITPELVLNPIGGSIINNTYNLPITHDSINLKYDINKYQYNSTILGGEGKYIKFKINQKNLVDSENYRVLKDRELYRFGIEFYNNLGQTSEPQWMLDYKMPSGNLESNFNTVEVTLKPEFYTWLNAYTFENENDRIVGYRILRADRTVVDKTIICQGILGGMMINTVRDSANIALFTVTEKKEDCKIQSKIPNFLLRNFQKVTPLQGNSNLLNMQFRNDNPATVNDVYNSNPLTEIQYDAPFECETHRKADTYQYTTMYQMYSPEIMFGNVNINNSTKFNIIGGAINTKNAWWGQERNIVNKVVQTEGKTVGKITPHSTGGTNYASNGSITSLMLRGLISDSNGSDADKTVSFNQFYREYNSFKKGTSNNLYSIYGTPELTERGQGDTVYNNNSKYIYKNNLEGFLSDGVQGRCDGDGYKDEGENQRAIISVNSYGAKCITFVPDRGDNVDVDPWTRKTLEQLYAESGIANTNTVLVSEFVRPTNDLYLSGIYGGNTYEDKSRGSYLQIGDYSDVSTNLVQIDSPGDTYVQIFKFTRISKTDVEVYSKGVNQHTELVSVKLETTVDLKNRNDISISTWDSRFQPKYEDYHKYNKVYSQQPTLVKSIGVDFNFKRIQGFDTRIQATKLKIPNESIDSWTDILPNEVMDLNGKFGPINGFVSFNDNLYTFQDEAIASISINPRVQVQGNDGVGIELGTGGVLYDYKYITTKSGSINKWGIIPTKKGIYYYDALNKNISRIPDAFVNSLSDIKGLHTYFNNNYNLDMLRLDNPIKRNGVVFGYDNYNNEVFFTLLQGDKSFTRCYNEAKEEFIDLKSYKPSMYINKADKLISVHPTNKFLYEHNKGEYNKFYGDYQPSYIILQVNPESDQSCIYDSIFYNSELYLKDIDQPNKTITHIQAYNEYQDSGRIPLIIGRDKNLRRKFREWKAQIPRDNRSRIRNPWIYLKLELENTSNYKLILHDINISYTI